MSRLALIVDFGGVLTTPVLDAYTAFCDAEGLDVRDFRRVIRRAYREASDDDPIVRLELGLLEPEEFEAHLARALSDGLARPIAPDNLIQRILGSVVADRPMTDAVRRAHDAGIATGLLSNSWGRTEYPDELAQLFDVIVISAREHLRKPDPRIFRVTLERLGTTPDRAVFVDDARPNCEAAEALGMRTILHRDPATTIPELERFLDVKLR